MVNKKILDQLQTEAAELLATSNIEGLINSFIQAIPQPIAQKDAVIDSYSLQLSEAFNLVSIFLGNRAQILLHLSTLQGEYYNAQTREVVKNLMQIRSRLLSSLQALLIKLNSENEAINQWQKTNPLANRTQALILKQKISNIGVEKVIQLNQSLGKWFSHYSFLADHVHSRMNEQVEIRDFDLDEELEHLNNATNTLHSRNDVAYHLFLINIKLAEVDEGYNCNRETIDLLLELSSKIKFYEANSTSTIRKWLDYKCNFIILKILRRWVKHHPELRYSVLVNSDRFSYSIQELSKSDNIGLFSPLDIKSINHYGDYDKAFDLSNQRFVEIILAIKTDLSITSEQVHYLCKFLKKNAFNIVSNEHPTIRYVHVLDALKRVERKLFQLLRTTNVINGKYDLYSYETCYYLCANAYLKLKSEETIVNFKDFRDARAVLDQIQSLWTDVIEKQALVKDIQQHTPIICAILSKTYCEVILAYIQKFEKLATSFTDPIDNYQSLIDKLLNTYTNAVSSYREILHSSEKAKILPFYLKTEECFIPVDKQIMSSEERDQTVFQNFENLFLDSSYVFPTDYEYLHQQIESWVSQYRFAELKFYHLIYQSKVANFDSKFKEQQYSIITVIGLYAGFITYVLSTVSIVSKLERSYVAMFLFLLIYASALSLFVLLLKLVFKSSSDKLSLGDLIIRPSRKVWDSENLKPHKWQIHNNLLFMGLIGALIYFSIAGVKKFSDLKIPAFHSSKETIYKTIVIDKRGAKVQVDTVSSAIVIDSSAKE